MRQDFSQQSRAEMPTISPPHALDGKAFGELFDANKNVYRNLAFLKEFTSAAHFQTK
jgi:hypothetical protein